MESVSQAIAALDWNALSQSLDTLGYALTPRLLDADACAALAALYAQDRRFRSTVTMARHGFGKGEYRYFAYPLPDTVQALRAALYPPLARIANQWSERLGLSDIWPDNHAALIDRCHAFGQPRPTPLLLRYRAGDYNCLHQDLYGPIHFPLQAVVMLSAEDSFTGGALTLVENRPRMQSRVEVVPIRQGQIAIVPVRDKPRMASGGWSKSAMRHGVSTVLSGERQTLGIIFHDAG
ncbi:2OG-Fe(II) oxygenase [Novosphingobium sp. NDB2Meth1]|uniref:2OG-Fe(II) oxygenase n=1 Tax=Novosphingobium sp. NDB2Meth1 TaxID=1892847 RepID=UPI0009306B09|nr:2OG-Fe(II) oxygenase [Novosphingobium sp. NDB2Meth1]